MGEIITTNNNLYTEDLYSLITVDDVYIEGSSVKNAISKINKKIKLLERQQKKMNWRNGGRRRR